MVKTMNKNVSSSSVDETKKQRNKQAKREAKAMLAVEQAKQAVQKAEQKVAKFQARLEARVAHLRTLEAKLGRIRTSPHVAETGTSGGGVDGHQEQSEPAQEGASVNVGGSQAYTITEEDEASTGAPVPASPVNTAPPTDQEVSLPPTEGRTDILQDQETASTPTASDTSTPLPQEVSLPPTEGRPDILQDQETTSSPAQMREEALDTEDNFQGNSDSEKESTPAYNTTGSSQDSEETETQEGLGSATWQAGPRLTLAEKEREWQPEEDASQDTGTGD